MPRGGIRKNINKIGRGPREQYCSVPRGGVKKKKDRSRTERAVSLCATRWRLKKRGREREIGRGPREQYRSVPRGGVRKEGIGRGPRERCRSVPQDGVKKRERERDRSRTERVVSLCATGWR